MMDKVERAKLIEECALMIGAFPCRQYGDHEAQLFAARVLTDAAAALLKRSRDVATADGDLPYESLTYEAKALANTVMWHPDMIQNLFEGKPLYTRREG